MKKLTFLLAMMGMFAITSVQAQSKKCCSSKKGAAAEACAKESKTKVASASMDYDMHAAKMASMDETVERKVCAETGAVSYMKSETSEKTGEVSSVAVNFDPELGQFVNVSPSGKAECAGKKAACCKKGAKAASAEAKEEGSDKAKVKLVKTTSGTK